MNRNTSEPSPAAAVSDSVDVSVCPAVARSTDCRSRRKRDTRIAVILYRSRQTPRLECYGQMTGEASPLTAR